MLRKLTWTRVLMALAAILMALAIGDETILLELLALLSRVE